MKIHLRLAAAFCATFLLASMAVAAPSADAPSAFTLDATRVELITANGPLPLRSVDGLFDRLFIPEKGVIRLRVTTPALLAGREVDLTAPNGGKLELGRAGEAPPPPGGELRFTSKSGESATLDLTFTPTLGRGAYTIAIRHAGATAVIDLWAGATAPPGQTGPRYEPARPTQAETIP